MRDQRAVVGESRGHKDATLGLGERHHEVGWRAEGLDLQFLAAYDAAALGKNVAQQRITEQELIFALVSVQRLQNLVLVVYPRPVRDSMIA